MFDSLTTWYLGRGAAPEAAVEAAWWTGLGALLTAAFLLHFVFRFAIARVVGPVVRRLGFRASETVLEAGVLRWIAHLVPAVFLHSAAPGFLGADGAAVPAWQTFA